MRRAVLLLLLGASTGCVYFNGVYNANEAARRGDARLRRGSEGDAATFFLTSAEKAETVLVRHPDSKWQSRALYLAGRGAALGGRCEEAAVRLDDFLSRPDGKVADRNRARLARGICELRMARVASARTQLDSLITVPNAETAAQARLWAARAALAAGDRDAVPQYLGSAGSGVLSWELVMSSLNAKEFVRVESLLVERARQADYRDVTMRALRDLSTANEWNAVENIVRGYDAARIRETNRASMHYLVGDLSLRQGRDSLARHHLTLARTLAGRDTVILREASARLALMPIDSARTAAEVDAMLMQQDSAVRATPHARRVRDNLLFVNLLTAQQEPTGAALYLAAEVARDSLRAPLLARALFVRVAQEFGASPLAPQALYAASLLSPDSAALWRSRIQNEYANTAVAAWLRGEDPALQPDFNTSSPLLQLRWNQTIRVWADSVRKLGEPVRGVGR